MALILVHLETKTKQIVATLENEKITLSFFFLLGHPLDLITEPQQHL